MIVDATPKLADLLIAYKAARTAEDEAKTRKEALSDQLKQAMLEQAQAQDPNDPLTETELFAGEAKAVLKQQTSTRLDATKLKADYPVVYAAYAKQSSTLVLTVKLA